MRALGKRVLEPTTVSCRLARVLRKITLENMGHSMACCGLGMMGAITSSCPNHVMIEEMGHHHDMMMTTTICGHNPKG